MNRVLSRLVPFPCRFQRHGFFYPMRTWTLLFIALAASSCGPAQDRDALTLGAYAGPREAYREIIPLFQKRWKEKTGRDIDVRSSFAGSDAQSRAIAAGFEADVAALASEADLSRLEKAGLVEPSWRKGRFRGMAAYSLVVIVTRPGNPQKIRDWSDLAKRGLTILAPQPKTSGPAQWNFLALYGAAERGVAEPYAGGPDGAFRYAVDVFKNARVLDLGSRESLLSFERGWGDAAIASESEFLAARKAGSKNERVVPRSTILVQNPVAVVDAYAAKHNAREAARAFVDFLWTMEAQTAFARHGFRPVDRRALGRVKTDLPPVRDLWTIDDLGGWEQVGTSFFGPGGVYDTVMEEAYAARS
jgi:sulfate/thiosulfate transport system substrate-binding protein